MGRAVFDSPDTPLRSGCSGLRVLICPTYYLFAFN
jgi:hypothetical protein